MDLLCNLFIQNGISTLFSGKLVIYYYMCVFPIAHRHQPYVASVEITLTSLNQIYLHFPITIIFIRKYTCRAIHYTHTHTLKMYHTLLYTMK